MYVNRKPGRPRSNKELVVGKLHIKDSLLPRNPKFGKTGLAGGTKILQHEEL